MKLSWLRGEGEGERKDILLPILDLSNYGFQTILPYIDCIINAS